MSNLVPRQYREVSVTAVDFSLTPDELERHFLGREVYQRTRYLVVRNGVETAVLEVSATPGSQVMRVVTAVGVLAGPAECAFVVDPDVDTGVPSSLAAAAAWWAPGCRGVVVEGRYHHVNFILDPSRARVRVVDVVPPGPPKLVDQASRLLAGAEDLPPIELVADVVDLADLARAHPAPRYLLPCRGSGFTSSSGAEVAFLDERPPRQDWMLIGCSRSRELHRWFYGDLPATVEMCPRVLAEARPRGGAAMTLTKCCLLEDRIEEGGNTVVVPWGASLHQVRQGLEAAARLAGAAAVAGSAGAVDEGAAVPEERTWSHG